MNLFALNLRAWNLAADAQAVVALRLARLALGNAAAADEAWLMITEKMKAAAEVHVMLSSAALTGSPHGPRRAMEHVHKQVRANRRRLSSR